MGIHRRDYIGSDLFVMLLRMRLANIRQQFMVIGVYTAANVDDVPAKASIPQLWEKLGNMRVTINVV